MIPVWYGKGWGFDRRTASMRDKNDRLDYRFWPETNLPPLRLRPLNQPGWYFQNNYYLSIIIISNSHYFTL